MLCTKKIEDLTPQELKELQKLSKDYQIQLKTESSPVGIIEIIDEDLEKYNNTIKKLNREILNTNKENKRLKMIAVASCIIILILLILILLLCKRINGLKKQSD